MNEKDKRSYYNNYRGLYNRLVNKFRPAVEKALRAQVKQFTDQYASQPHVTPDIISSKPLKASLRLLHITAGLSNATRVYKDLKRQISKGTSDQETLWTWVINEYLKAHGLDNLVIEITNTLKEKIKAEILKGNEAGLGVDEIVRGLNKSSFPKWMAERIVRTELNQATNTGAMVAAADLNIAVNKEWLSAEDNRTRRIPRDQYDHLHMNGIQVGYNERFVVPSTKTIDAMLYPGDPSASAGNLCNCRCTVVFVPIRDAHGRVVRIGQAQPSGTGQGQGDTAPLPMVNVPAGSVYSEFHDLLKRAAELGVTRFVVNQILNEDSGKKE